MSHRQRQTATFAPHARTVAITRQLIISLDSILILSGSCSLTPEYILLCATISDAASFKRHNLYRTQEKLHRRNYTGEIRQDNLCGRIYAREFISGNLYKRIYTQRVYIEVLQDNLYSVTSMT